MKKFMFLLTAALAISLVFSCSEEDGSTNNNQTDWNDYVQLKVGHSFEFDDYKIDENGESLWLIGRTGRIIDESMYLGKECFHGGTFTAGGLNYLNWFQYLDGSEFYVSGHLFLLNMSSSPLRIFSPECWVKSIDFEKQTWEG